ncbi:FAD-dependent oxidoreductase [Modestobacter lapidis]|nr:FAD-dependent oxidoreductase [Modestobacter lapidis]
MTGRRVTVIGGGVLGLSLAHQLAAGGDVVTVVADREGADTVSAVAAAVWFPYRSGSPSLATWLTRSLARFTELAADGAAGVDLREGTVVERRPDVDRSWAAGVPASRGATAAELPPGALGGVRATLPVVTMSRYLPWLRARCADAGVWFQRRSVRSVEELAPAADLVVVAAGLRSGQLLGDDTMYPIRGQVVRLANPGLTAWVIDDDHPDGLTYVVPRRDDVVCGGVAEVGSAVTEPDPETERAILRRTTELVPALVGQPVLSRAVGLRPGRDAVRLEHVAGHAVPVIACYGHGGSGVTLSWGCAEAVAALAAGG